MPDRPADDSGLDVVSAGWLAGRSVEAMYLILAAILGKSHTVKRLVVEVAAEGACYLLKHKSQAKSPNILRSAILKL